MSEMKRVLDALCDSYELELFNAYETIRRVREICQEWYTDISNSSEEMYYNKIIKALDGEK